MTMIVTTIFQTQQ